MPSGAITETNSLTAGQPAKLSEASTLWVAGLVKGRKLLRAAIRRSDPNSAASVLEELGPAWCQGSAQFTGECLAMAAAKDPDSGVLDVLVQHVPSWIANDGNAVAEILEHVSKLCSEEPNLDALNSVCEAAGRYWPSLQGVSALHVAARSNHLAAVRKRLDRGEDVNATTHNGSTSLHFACCSGHLPIVELLLERGADINMSDQGGHTALHAAAMTGQTAVVQLLLEHAAGRRCTMVKKKSSSEEEDKSVARSRAMLTAARMLGSDPSSLSGHSRQDLGGTFAGRSSALDTSDDEHWAKPGKKQGHGNINIIRSPEWKGGMAGAGADRADSTGLDSTLNSAMEVVWRPVEGFHIDARDDIGRSALHWAARYGHVDAVKELIDIGATVDAGDDMGHTPLHLAASGYPEVVQALLEANARVNARDNSGGTPLHVAARYGQKVLAYMLTEQGADVNAMDEFGCSILFAAAMGGHTEMVKMLAAMGADLNAKDIYEGRAMHWAAGHGQVSVVKELHALGQDIDSRDAYQQTPLHIAAMDGHLEVVQELLELGAQLDSTNISGRSALMLAAQHGHGHVVHALAARGLRVDAMDDAGDTALHVAAAEGMAEMTSTLLTLGAKPNVRDAKKRTPLFMAAQNGHEHVVQQLLRNGADMNLGDHRERSPLCVAAIGGFEGVVELLGRAGADMQRQDVTGGSALFWAAGHGKASMVRLLVKLGSSTKETDKCGQTALHVAAASGNADVAEVLVDVGASLEAFDDDGCNPLHIAAKQGNNTVIQVLVDMGARMDARTQHGCTALHLAAMRGQVHSLQLLIDLGLKPGIKDANGGTALHWAAGHGQCGSMVQLMESGANVNALDSNRQTPLHVAAAAGAYEAVLTLVGVGCKVRAADAHKRTPLTWATRHNHAKVMNVLERQVGETGDIGLLTESELERLNQACTRHLQLVPIVSSNSDDSSTGALQDITNSGGSRRTSKEGKHMRDSMDSTASDEEQQPNNPMYTADEHDGPKPQAGKAKEPAKLEDKKIPGNFANVPRSSLGSTSNSPGRKAGRRGGPQEDEDGEEPAPGPGQPFSQKKRQSWSPRAAFAPAHQELLEMEKYIKDKISNSVFSSTDSMEATVAAARAGRSSASLPPKDAGSLRESIDEEPLDPHYRPDVVVAPRSQPDPAADGRKGSNKDLAADSSWRPSSRKGSADGRGSRPGSAAGRAGAMYDDLQSDGELDTADLDDTLDQDRDVSRGRLKKAAGTKAKGQHVDQGYGSDSAHQQGADGGLASKRGRSAGGPDAGRADKSKWQDETAVHDDSSDTSEVARLGHDAASHAGMEADGKAGKAGFGLFKGFSRRKTQASHVDQLDSYDGQGPVALPSQIPGQAGGSTAQPDKVLLDSSSNAAAPTPVVAAASVEPLHEGIVTYKHPVRKRGNKSGRSLGASDWDGQPDSPDHQPRCLAKVGSSTSRTSKQPLGPASSAASSVAGSATGRAASTKVQEATSPQRRPSSRNSSGRATPEKALDSPGRAARDSPGRTAGRDSPKHGSGRDSPGHASQGSHGRPTADSSADGARVPVFQVGESWARLNPDASGALSQDSSRMDSARGNPAGAGGSSAQNSPNPSPRKGLRGSLGFRNSRDKGQEKVEETSSQLGRRTSPPTPAAGSSSRAPAPLPTVAAGRAATTTAALVVNATGTSSARASTDQATMDPSMSMTSLVQPQLSPRERGGIMAPSSLPPASVHDMDADILSSTRSPRATIPTMDSGEQGVFTLATDGSGSTLAATAARLAAEEAAGHGSHHRDFNAGYDDDYPVQPASGFTSKKPAAISRSTLQVSRGSYDVSAAGLPAAGQPSPTGSTHSRASVRVDTSLSAWDVNRTMDPLDAPPHGDVVGAYATRPSVPRGNHGVGDDNGPTLGNFPKRNSRQQADRDDWVRARAPGYSRPPMDMDLGRETTRRRSPGAMDHGEPAEHRMVIAREPELHEPPPPAVNRSPGPQSAAGRSRVPVIVSDSLDQYEHTRDREYGYSRDREARDREARDRDARDREARDREARDREARDRDEYAGGSRSGSSWRPTRGSVQRLPGVDDSLDAAASRLVIARDDAPRPGTYGGARSSSPAPSSASARHANAVLDTSFDLASRRGSESSSTRLARSTSRDAPREETRKAPAASTRGSESGSVAGSAKAAEELTAGMRYSQQQAARASRPDVVAANTRPAYPGRIGSQSMQPKPRTIEGMKNSESKEKLSTFAEAGRASGTSSKADRGSNRDRERGVSPSRSVGERSSRHSSSGRDRSLEPGSRDRSREKREALEREYREKEIRERLARDREARERSAREQERWERERARRRDARSGTRHASPSPHYAPSPRARDPSPKAGGDGPGFRSIPRTSGRSERSADRYSPSSRRSDRGGYDREMEMKERERARRRQEREVEEHRRRGASRDRGPDPSGYADSKSRSRPSSKGDSREALNLHVQASGGRLGSRSRVVPVDDGSPGSHVEPGRRQLVDSMDDPWGRRY